MIRPHFRARMPGSDRRIAWKAGREIDGERLVPFLGRIVFDPREMARDRVVNQDVERPEPLQAGGDDAFDAGLTGEIRLVIADLHAMIVLQLGKLRLDGAGELESMHHDIATRPR